MGQILNLVRATTVAVLVVAVAACGGDDDASSPANPASTAGTTGAGTVADRPSVVVTTNILGDLVSEAVGDLADVEVIMPLGSDPHDFAPSARQAEAMADADLLVINGAGFEEGMLDVIESAEEAGAPTFVFADQVDLIEATGEPHADEHSEEEGEHSEETDEHSEEEGEHSEEEGEHSEETDEHSDEASEHSEEEGEHDEHAAGSDDPHIFTDPARMATAVGALGTELGELPGVDAAAMSAQVDAYIAELEALDAEVEETLAPIPEADRVLVTNHEVFGYFADRYDFEVLGAVIPSLTTNAQASAADITALAEVTDEAGVPAIFGETTQSSDLAEALADEVGGDVEVVELFTESLGEPGSGGETYVDMMRVNADRIVEALT